MLRIGIVGFGFMGRMHYRCWQGVPDARVVAICETNPRALEALGQPAGNIAGAAQTLDLRDVALFEDAARMLAEARLDAVSITLPTHLHADLACQALAAGVAVLCEKPMALTLAACDRMAAAAHAARRPLLIGHCIRFWPEYVVARELVRSGTYGAVRAATFRRFGAAPGWGGAQSWFTDRGRSGGMALDLHVHDADYIHYLFGLPESVCTAAARAPDGGLGFLMTRYNYPDNRVVIAEASWLMTPSFGFEMSFTLVLERATVVFDPARTPAFRVCPGDGEAFTPPLPAGDGYAREIEHFARVVRGEEALTVVTPEQSRETVRLVLAEEDSAARGCRVSLA